MPASVSIARSHVYCDLEPQVAVVTCSVASIGERSQQSQERSVLLLSWRPVETRHQFVTKTRLFLLVFGVGKTGKVRQAKAQN